MKLPVIRPRVVPIAELKREILAEEGVSAEDFDELDALRPKTRAECRGGIRPCPFVACKYHLYLEVTEAGSLRIVYPHLEVWEMEFSCALDLVEMEPDGMTLKEIGALLNVSKESVRQTQERGLDELAPKPRKKTKAAKRRVRRGPHHSAGVRQRAMEAMLEEGASLGEVHDELGVSVRTLRDWRDGRSRWSSAWLKRAKLTQKGSHGTAQAKEE